MLEKYCQESHKGFKKDIQNHGKMVYGVVCLGLAGVSLSDLLHTFDTDTTREHANYFFMTPGGMRSSRYSWQTETKGSMPS